MVAQSKHRRAPVVRVRRNQRRKADHPSTAFAGSRRPARSSSSSVVEGTGISGGAATERPHAQPLLTREQRAKKRGEKKNLLQQLADAERRAQEAERERDELLAEKDAIYDRGTEVWQNLWAQDGVSSLLAFPTNKSVLCSSIEHYGGNCMPGVHALGTIDKGRTTQSIWVKGAGYTLVGLVTSDEEKDALIHRAGNSDFSKMPFMTMVFSSDRDEQKGDAFTIEVDMKERRAELYVSDNASSRLITPHKVWENLPDKVWVAVAFKRNSGREAVLLPCIHWLTK
ncbi:hypothetical protein ACHAWF_008318 [Thalassiosira exigua]